MPGSQAMDTLAPTQALEKLERGTRNQVPGDGPGVCVPERRLEGADDHNGEGDGNPLPSPMAHQQLRLRYEGGKLKRSVASQPDAIAPVSDGSCSNSSSSSSGSRSNGGSGGGGGSSSNNKYNKKENATLMLLAKR
ncbi:unnamed protein product [Ectocarpus sp. 6 AP-2014]